MVKTYGLAVENTQRLIALKLPPMSQEQAWKARAILQAQSGKTVFVVNLESMES